MGNQSSVFVIIILILPADAPDGISWNWSGNVVWTGGMGIGGGHWYEEGSEKGEPFNIVKGMYLGKLSSFAVPQMYFNT